MTKIKLEWAPEVRLALHAILNGRETLHEIQDWAVTHHVEARATIGSVSTNSIQSALNLLDSAGLATYTLRTDGRGGPWKRWTATAAGRAAAHVDPPADAGRNCDENATNIVTPAERDHPRHKRKQACESPSSRVKSQSVKIGDVAPPPAGQSAADVIDRFDAAWRRLARLERATDRLRVAVLGRRPCGPGEPGVVIPLQTIDPDVQATENEPTFGGMTVTEYCDRVQRRERFLVTPSKTERPGKREFFRIVEAALRRRGIQSAEIDPDAGFGILRREDVEPDDFLTALDDIDQMGGPHGLELVPTIGLQRVIAVMRAGEPEHGDRWKTRTVHHHLGAALRHVGRHLSGQAYDHDLHQHGYGLHSHLACAGARVLMALHLEATPESPEGR